jgi:hypothetical protein
MKTNKDGGLILLNMKAHFKTMIRKAAWLRAKTSHIEKWNRAQN